MFALNSVKVSLPCFISPPVPEMTPVRLLFAAAVSMVKLLFPKANSVAEILVALSVASAPRVTTSL